MINKIDDPEKRVKQDIAPESTEELLQADQDEVQNESDKNKEDFNFVGLPQRDLKKNLGCG